MSQTYGIEAPGARSHAGNGHRAHPPAARYLVLIESASAGRRVAHMVLASHAALAEFDASAPEVQLMTKGLAAASGAEQAVWDAALGGHSAEERLAAEIFTLDA